MALHGRVHVQFTLYGKDVEELRRGSCYSVCVLNTEDTTHEDVWIPHGMDVTTDYIHEVHHDIQNRVDLVVRPVPGNAEVRGIIHCSDDSGHWSRVRHV